MNKQNIVILTLLFLASCYPLNNDSNVLSIDSSSEEINFNDSSVLSVDSSSVEIIFDVNKITEYDLQDNVIKVKLISIMEEINFEKTNSILREYLIKKTKLEKTWDYYDWNKSSDDEFEKYYLTFQMKLGEEISKTIDTIYETSNISKKKIASIIYHYEFDGIEHDCD